MGYGKINICITLTKINSRLTTFRLPENPFHPTWFVIKTVYDIYQHSLHNKHHNLRTIRPACKGRLHPSFPPRHTCLYLNYQRLCIYVIYSLHFMSVLTATRTCLAVLYVIYSLHFMSVLTATRTCLAVLYVIYSSHFMSVLTATRTCLAVL